MGCLGGGVLGPPGHPPGYGPALIYKMICDQTSYIQTASHCVVGYNGSGSIVWLVKRVVVHVVWPTVCSNLCFQYKNSYCFCIIFHIITKLFAHTYKHRICSTTCFVTVTSVPIPALETNRRRFIRSVASSYSQIQCAVWLLTSFYRTNIT